ncbi:MAG: hypothetical protein K0Q93_2716 [Nocardioidaceae bacterium]|nr:hypothetical protein [Nocardioidaceae bacterium]
MATTLEAYAPFATGAGANVTEDTWRKFMALNQGGSGVLRGVLQDFVLFADSTGMQVKVAPGECWIRGHWGTKTTETILPIATNSSGNPRKDRVVLRADFLNDRIELDVLTGTPAVTPVAPTLTQNSSMWETSLGYVSVPAGDDTIGLSQIDRTGACDYTSSFTKYTRATGSNQLIPTSTLTKVEFTSAVQFSSSGVTVSGTNNTDFTLARGGEWTITACLNWQSTGSDFDGSRYLIIGDTSGPTTRYAVASTRPDPTDIGLGGALNTTVTDRFAVGTAFSVWAYQNSGSSLNVAPSSSIAPVLITLRWNGW